MARTKLFSDDDVINNVADVFATHGYGGTSISMLIDATGLGKQSLYNSFGDKQSLYLKAINCTTARYGEISALMDAAPSGMAAIEIFFESLVKACMSNDPVEHSCIVSSGLLEAINDDVINNILCSKWRNSHAMIERTIKRGQADGSIHKNDSPAELADFLIAVVSGIRVSSRVVTQASRLRKTVNHALALLRESEVKL
jgi:TetR/AcrR family transcriptional regulator, transcriptional repressor for nem operon